MSVYAKFLDNYKSKLCESKSKKVSLKKLKRVNESDEIIDELKDFEPDIMDNIYHKESVFQDVAEYTAKSNGYVYYSTRYGREQAICINVKGRPNINVDIPDDMYEIAQDYIDTYISDLADSLHEEDNDFVIYGRSGGYWGYENFEEHIVISDKGYKVLKDKVIELMKDEDKADWSLYNIVVNHTEELGDLLDASHLTLSKDFLEKLEDLSSIIDTNEKIINDELKEMMENEGVNESCGKRKPRKPFPRKSKLCESKSKKVSLRKLKRVNESDWKDDLAIRKNIYKIVFPILQKELLNVKFIDKRIDNETFVEHFEEYFDIETMFNSKSYISFIGDDYIIQIIEDTFTDYLGYRYEYSEDADNTYDLNVSGLIQQTVDTIVKAIPKMEDALKAKLGEFNASSVKVKSNLLDDAGGINIEYHFKSNDTISESAKDRFRKKTFSKSKLSESKKEWEEDLKKTFDHFKEHLITAYSYLGNTIALGDSINKNLSYYPQEIQDFMSEIDLNKLKEISDNMRPIVKGAAKTFYDTYGW